MELTVLTKDQCEIVRQWRNDDISGYRTSFLLTKEMQEDFYKNVVCNRNSDCRFWGVINNIFIGMVGLVDISFENRNAEISIIIDSGYRRNGQGSQALKLLLDKGFNELNLDNIYGECYTNNDAEKFWIKQCELLKAEFMYLPKRKYWNGKYYDSLYFNFGRSK